MAKENENIELAKEHLEIAGQLINEESKRVDLDKNKEKEFSEAEFALEKAESEVSDLEENPNESE